MGGISVTKEMSATTRMVLDSVRTLVIWGVSLAIGWQPFQALQLLGFAVLVTGMCVYNDIVIAPLDENLLKFVGPGTIGWMKPKRKHSHRYPLRLMKKLVLILSFLSYD